MAVAAQRADSLAMEAAAASELLGSPVAAVVRAGGSRPAVRAALLGSSRAVAPQRTEGSLPAGFAAGDTPRIGLAPCCLRAHLQCDSMACTFVRRHLSCLTLDCA